MFDFDICISKKSDDKRLLLKLPVHYYLIFFIISICLFLTIILNGSSIISYIFLFISVTALTYKESWVFNKSENNSYYKMGLGFIYKKVSFDIKNIDLIELVTFIKGRNNNTEENSKFSFLNKKYYSIKLHLDSGEDFTLLTVSGSKKIKLDLILDSLENITNVKVER